MSPKQEVQRLIADLGGIPKEFRRHVRPQIKSAAQSVVDDAKRRAAWSKRIPGAIRVGARLSKRNQGVVIRVNAKKAPHARAYEGMSARGSTFRHPVYGNRERWVSQQTRPFLWPAAKGRMDDVRNAVDKAIREAAQSNGWREGI